jgi:chromate transporter
MPGGRAGQSARPFTPLPAAIAARDWTTSMAVSTESPAAPLHPTRPQLFFAFARIGLTSFGGGLSGWLLRDFVESRRWMSRKDFLNGLAVAQALPGVNVTNMSIWIGYRLHGPLGAAIGFTGILLPSTVLILLLGMLFAALTDYGPVQIALTGAAAAAVGLPMNLGVTSAIHLRRHILPISIAIGTFLAVVWLHVPLLRVVILAGAASVSVEWVRLRRARR